VVALHGGAKATSGNGCTGAIKPDLYGYSDFRAGTKLIVEGSEGAPVAVGHLDPGTLIHPKNLDANPDFQDCVFPFTIKNIPSGESSYFVGVKDRGGINFAEEEADSLKISFTREG
jgi:hypothetical protein